LIVRGGWGGKQIQRVRLGLPSGGKGPISGGRRRVFRRRVYYFPSEAHT